MLLNLLSHASKFVYQFVINLAAFGINLIQFGTVKKTLFLYFSSVLLLDISCPLKFDKIFPRTWWNLIQSPNKIFLHSLQFPKFVIKFPAVNLILNLKLLDIWIDHFRLMDTRYVDLVVWIKHRPIKCLWEQNDRSEWEWEREDGRYVCGFPRNSRMYKRKVIVGWVFLLGELYFRLQNPWCWLN